MVDPGPQSEVALQSLRAQVEVSVPQTQDLVGLDPLADRDRRGLGAVQQLDGSGRDLDRAGREVGVRRALGPVADRALDPEHVLGADRVGVESGRRVGVDYHLDDAARVAQVEEHDPAVIAASRDPAAQGDGAVDVAGPQVAGPVGAHRRGGHRAGSAASAWRRIQPATCSRGTSTCSPLPRSLTPTLPRSASRGPSMTP